MIPPSLWPWRLIGKLAGVLVVASLLVWLFLLLKGWHDDSQALPGVELARDQAIAETARVRKDFGIEVTRLQSLNQGLIDEKETLRTVRAATPARTVRLCSAASETRPAIASDPPATAGDHAAVARTGPLPETPGRDPEAGPDVGPDLYALMDEADDVVKNARGGQVYMRGLPQACSVAQ